MAKDHAEQAIANTEKKLRRIAALIKQNGRKILTNYPITSPQFIALQWIIEDGQLTIGELSKKIGLAFSTTTDLVDRMEKNQLVERVRDSQDRRVVRIHVLEKGKIIIDEVILKRQQYLGDVLESVSDDQKIEINEMLRLLYEQMRLVNEKEQKRR